MGDVVKPPVSDHKVRSHSAAWGIGSEAHPAVLMQAQQYLSVNYGYAAEARRDWRGTRVTGEKLHKSATRAETSVRIVGCQLAGGAEY